MSEWLAFFCLALVLGCVGWLVGSALDREIERINRTSEDSDVDDDTDSLS